MAIALPRDAMPIFVTHKTSQNEELEKVESRLYHMMVVAWAFIKYGGRSTHIIFSQS